MTTKTEGKGVKKGGAQKAVKKSAAATGGYAKEAKTQVPGRAKKEKKQPKSAG